MFPLVDCFDGSVLSIETMKKLISTNDTVIADASLYLQNHDLDLSQIPFDGIALSFEKMFGFPNIGALVVKNSLISTIKRPYFGGGTLVYALTETDFEKLRLSPCERFEDGSLPFISILSLQSGFAFRQLLGIERLQAHVKSIVEHTLSKLDELVNVNKLKIEVYGTNQESIISFNILDKKSKIIPYQKVIEAASEFDIYLLGGCHSTPTTCKKSLKTSENQINEGIGSLQVSFGWATTKKEIDFLIQFVKHTAEIS
ncbi:molybdenum cofactor sulfurase [Histomonas meleagridis]|uniref:molybdenum cofactor sulfurase n=1 Tax=Histomonas meleagridis TaxID=135588 RepID=UPI0035598244|nr:molybdenum cofactor sulfurase [Histomonas meleagridis]KAH0806767.1 molybdenum cofactor sulfurase [Histomonas meleagridis]